MSYPSITQTVVQSKIDNSRSSFSTTLVDSFGRIIRTATANAEATPYDLADVCYDSNGRVSFQSYTYQASSYTGANVCSGAGDSFTYDGLGRPTQVTHSGGTHANSSYTGRAQQVTDEGNGTYSVSRIMQSDALGRLTGVCEVSSSTLLGSGGTPNGCGLDIAATGFLTSYAYDLLGNLTSITQGSLTNRSFSYDSLSRMTSESHPEWGSGSQTLYAYNNDGLLTSRTRPAPNQTNPATTVTTNFGYDALHRLTSRSYSGDTTGTPYTGFSYDQATAWSQTLSNTIGRLSSEFSGATGQIFGYDPVGRVTINWQCTPRVCGTTAYLMSYSYDLVGDLRSASNGVGVNFTYSYNTAPSLTSVTSSLVDTQHPATLLSNIHYGPFGVTSDTLGNGLSETIGYNPLGFLNSYSSTRYSFSLTGRAGNGLITAVNDSANGNWTYTYDQFNRLASSNKSTSPVQGFSYAYDRYGNRWQQNVTAGSGPAPQYLLDNTTNRINGSGITYDALGNMLTDGLGNSYTWDAENRLIKVNGGATATYTYDAEGRRVRNSSIEFLYDLAGRAVTLLNATTGGWAYGEIYAGGRHLATYSGSTTNFLHTDWLGTKRVMSSITGAQSQTCTSLPFGDALNCSGTEWNFSHFTDYMHDDEDNLEHTWFRQYSTTQGRFTAADPYLGSMDLNNPQSLNRYSYVLNSPTDALDPLGLVCSGNVGELYDTVCNPANFGGGGGSGAWGSDLDFLNWALNNPMPEIVGFVNVGNCDFCTIPLFELSPDLGLLLLSGNSNWGPSYNSSPGVLSPPRTCVGTARVLGGNPATVGHQGGVPNTLVSAGSAAAIPSQFHGKTGSVFRNALISGRVGYFGQLNSGPASISQSFVGITDVIGSQDVQNVRNVLMQNNPGELILELVTGSDMGHVPVEITIPGWMGCPAGTQPQQPAPRL